MSVEHTMQKMIPEIHCMCFQSINGYLFQQQKMIFQGIKVFQLKIMYQSCYHKTFRLRKSFGPRQDRHRLQFQNCRALTSKRVLSLKGIEVLSLIFWVIMMGKLLYGHKTRHLYFDDFFEINIASIITL